MSTRISLTRSSTSPKLGEDLGFIGIQQSNQHFLMPVFHASPPLSRRKLKSPRVFFNPPIKWENGFEAKKNDFEAIEFLHDHFRQSIRNFPKLRGSHPNGQIKEGLSTQLSLKTVVLQYEGPKKVFPRAASREQLIVQSEAFPQNQKTLRLMNSRVSPRSPSLKLIEFISPVPRSIKLIRSRTISHKSL